MFKKLFSVFIVLILIYLVNLFLYDVLGQTYFRFHIDKLMHLTGGLAVAWLALAFFAHHLDRLPGFERFLIVVSTVALAGVLWEFAEYLGQFFPTISHYLSGGDLADTLGDLASDLFGAFLVSLHLLWRRQA